MTPERMAALVARWTQIYTRTLPPPVARRRVEEIASDVHDHIAHERRQGTPESRIARGIASRMLRGVVADAAWRRRQIAALRSAVGTRTGPSLTRSFLRIVVGVAVVLAIPSIAMAFRSDVAWSSSDFAVAGVLLAVIGTALELAVHRAGRRSTALGIAIVGIGAGVAGQADDAPGLVLLGLLLIVSAAAMAVRVARRSR
jgi:hypothetical protein